MIDNNVYYFAGSTLGFYPLALKESVYDPVNAWPKDAVELDRDTYVKYTAQAPDGKVLGADGEGYPIWVDAPPPSEEDLIAINLNTKDALMAQVTIAIAPLQDAVDIEEATADEISLLKKWKQFRVAVNRIDANTPDEIEWPEKPA